MPIIDLGYPVSRPQHDLISARCGGRRRGAGLGGVMLVLAALGAGPTARAMPESPLQFDVAEGRNLNSFVRQGPVAAHLVLRSGRDLRILTAFPAGNSGVGLWFAPLAAAPSRLASRTEGGLVVADA